MTNGDSIILPNRLRELRHEMGWTAERVAQITGVAGRGVVSNWERANRTPSLETLLLLSRWYGVSVDYLLGVRGADRESPLVRMGRQVLRARFPAVMKSQGLFSPGERMRAAVAILQDTAPEAFFMERLAASVPLHVDEFERLLGSDRPPRAVLECFAEIAGIPARWLYGPSEEVQ